MPHPVGQQPSCRNASGVLDLLGNVAEWIFSCAFVQLGQESLPTKCLVRGGGYDQLLQACTSETSMPNDSRRRDLGFRCCADLSAEEQFLIAQ
jgi:formylglycine-generating enzyme required for sulfatase activity